MAYWDSMEARALLSRLVGEAVGTGLAMKSVPIWELCDFQMTPEARLKWTRDVELRFWLWAASKESDAEGYRTLGELQRFEFLNRLRDGETFSIFRYSGDARRMSPLSLQFIDPEYVTLPLGNTDINNAKLRGNRISEGIELSSAGEAVAIYVQEVNEYNTPTGKYKRVPIYGISNRRFVNHSIISDLPGQVRGVGPLAPVIHELEKMADYKLCEIEAALINAIIAAWIKPSVNAPASRPLGGITPRGGATAPQTTAAAPVAETNFTRPGLVVQNLKAGEEIVSFDTKRPNVSFDGFVKSITRSISAALSVPVEVLEMTFNQNYSASRASLILFWNTIERERSANVSQFLQPVYEAWFREEIRRNNIKASGFGTSPLIDAAWLATSWIGHSMPSIDPLKDAQADDYRIDQGATTLERVAQKYNGSDYYDNVAAQDRERELLPEPRRVVSKNVMDTLENPNAPEDDEANSEQNGNSSGDDKKKNKKEVDDDGQS